MAKIIKVVTSSLATLENTAPPQNLRIPDCSETLALADSILSAAGKFEPDIVLLPETFKSAGRSSGTFAEDAEPMDGPTVRWLSETAKRGHYHLVAGLLIQKGAHYSNDALVFNRDGVLAGVYSKNYPVESEIENGIVPGDTIPVFDLDFGRIGVAICFDLNWRRVWAQFTDSGIDLACWISAYEGGYPLSMYAQWHGYPVVSSVFSYHGKVVDITGETLVSTSRWNRIAYAELNLDREIYHTDQQMDKILTLQEKFGKDLTVRAFTEEHLFMVTNYRQDCTIKDIEKEFGLVSYADYIQRCETTRESRLLKN